MSVKTDKNPIYIDEYDYNLPTERIAKYPLHKRDESNLLVYKKGEILKDCFMHIDQYLSANSLLVYNNTRVIQARLVFHKPTGARIEVFCLEPTNPHDYSLSLSATKSCIWKCMVGNLKKWKSGKLTQFVSVDGKEIEFGAEITESNGNTHAVRFSWNADDITFSELLVAVGELPIPPYLNRKTEESDHETYQTVYSKIEGSVAAPTAGLHFTQEVFEKIKQKNIDTEELTLHVGAGTFQPVKSRDIAEHTMHTETIVVELKSLRKLKKNIGKIVAVGTTTVRTLETLYWIGANHIPTETNGNDAEKTFFHISQWEAYETETTTTPNVAIGNIIDFLEKNGLDTLFAETQIMIKPGYQFRLVNAMITNFHQPKSTLLLLVSAFLKGEWKRIYDFALNNDFRFLSYGDSSLLFPD